MSSSAELEELPITQVNSLVNLMIRDVATVRESKMPGEIDRAASQRYISINANVEGQDMGRASRQVAEAIQAAGKPPRGVRVMPMGQLGPMDEMFDGRWHRTGRRGFCDPDPAGCLFPIIADVPDSISALPGVIMGVVLLLFVTSTTINIESFMGTIMCIGVSVSNSVLLVTFMNEHWQGGKPALCDRDPAPPCPAVEPDGTIPYRRASDHRNPRNRWSAALWKGSAHRYFRRQRRR